MILRIGASGGGLHAAHAKIESMLSRFQYTRTKRRQKYSGFTIVELLIVVVVIGILAAIVTVAYTGVTDSARAASVGDAMKKVDKAMQLFVVENGYPSWPSEGVLGGGNPALPTAIATVPTLAKYLPSAPSVAGISASDWRYDNDGDTYNGCSANFNGVNIIIFNFTDATLAQGIDDKIDDGNVSCGKLRYVSASSQLVYSLSIDGAL